MKTKSLEDVSNGKITLEKYIQVIKNQMTIDDANSEVLTVGVSCRGGDYFYMIELSNGKQIEIPMYK